MIYIMWISYWNNWYTAFIISKKRLPIYHFTLTFIALFWEIVTLPLVLFFLFFGMLKESATISGLTSKIMKLDVEVHQLRTLLEHSSTYGSEDVSSSLTYLKWNPWWVFDTTHSWWVFDTTYSKWVVSNEATCDLVYLGLIALILFIGSFIIIIYLMWASYWNNSNTSFLIGKKRLPVHHFALISITILFFFLTFILVFLIAFTGMVVESRSINELSTEINRLDLEMKELLTLSKYYFADISGDLTTITTHGSEAVGTSPSSLEWDPWRVLNIEWFSHSPYSMETTTDIVLSGFSIFIPPFIILIYLMWASYWNNSNTSFLLGKKCLPIHHFILISITVFFVIMTFTLGFLMLFTGMVTEFASIGGLPSDITILDLDIQQLRTLLENYSNKN